MGCPGQESAQRPGQRTLERDHRAPHPPRSLARSSIGLRAVTMPDRDVGVRRGTSIGQGIRSR